MMVGEVRDAESAQIAIRMAITGHLVFSTLHTNDAVSAISRLMDMGIEPYLIPSSVEGIIAQRLVRKICEKCKTSFTPPKKVLEQLGVDEAKIKFYTGEGCPACRYSGYSGRTAIFEVLSLNNNLKSLISAKAPWELIKKQALSSGMKTLRQDGLEKAKAGITTLEEVLKVTE
jgi:type II secretory ATPase GspE/PulE/Tfp pilus assembly ATPase PilB-like protein